VSIDVPEKHIASIFRVEEISSARNQQTSKQVASRIIRQPEIRVYIGNRR
jgi:hypothetical protein